MRLCEAGLSSRAQDYCREIAEYVMRNPGRVETDFMPDFLSQLSYLADRLKYQVWLNVYCIDTPSGITILDTYVSYMPEWTYRFYLEAWPFRSFLPNRL